MTYSRPACLALIARVESGLTFGQLQPYADALREAVGEVERLEQERDAVATAALAHVRRWRTDELDDTMDALVAALDKVGVLI